MFTKTDTLRKMKIMERVDIYEKNRTAKIF